MGKVVLLRSVAPESVVGFKSPTDLVLDILRLNIYGNEEIKSFRVLCEVNLSISIRSVCAGTRA